MVADRMYIAKSEPTGNVRIGLKYSWLFGWRPRIEIEEKRTWASTNPYDWNDRPVEFLWRKIRRKDFNTTQTYRVVQ